MAEGFPAPGRISVRVRLFASQREIAGRREVELGLPPGASIEEAWAALVAEIPRLASGRAYVRFARNGAYAGAEERLEDRDELAVIPPVSGGAGEESPAEAEAAQRILELRSEPFPAGLPGDLAASLATPADGAVVTFVGRTRYTPGKPAPGQESEAARYAGRRVEELEYEAHESMAASILDAIANEMGERFGVVRLAIVHRTGLVLLGEPSVLVVVAAGHRDAAFAAARYAIDEAKARLPIWKAERFADGHVWIGEPARDGPA